jgi:hypothetical protein
MGNRETARLLLIPSQFPVPTPRFQKTLVGNRFPRISNTILGPSLQEALHRAPGLLGGAMTRACLNVDQRRTVQVIEALGFGEIVQLWVRGGTPCYDPEPHIIQTIKLGTDPELAVDGNPASVILRKEFVELFEQLQVLSDCTVDIEVHHGLPFRLSIRRRHADLVVTGDLA